MLQAIDAKLTALVDKVVAVKNDLVQFLKHPHLTQYRAFIAILTINTLAFAAECVHPSLMTDWALKSQDWGTWAGLAEIVTSMFTHANFGHYFFNMLIVFPFALYLEHRVGSLRFLAFWLLSGVGAALCFAYTPHLMESWACLGASGACFGVIAAACWLVDEHPIVRALALFVLVGLVWPNYVATIIGFIIPTGIASAAHLGGAASGLILANESKK